MRRDARRVRYGSHVRALDPDDSRPPYQQVAERLKTQIDAGDFEPGDKLPSHADLAVAFGVGVTTVKRALRQLQADGLIVTRQGQGAFVRVTRGIPRVGRAEDGEIDELRKQVADLADRLAVVEQKVGNLP